MAALMKRACTDAALAVACLLAVIVVACDLFKWRP